MRVSLIIAGKNEENAIARTIESCLETTPELDYEIIVVDDASTDGSVDEVQRRFSQVRVHRHPHRLGPSPAKATGGGYATGEFLVCSAAPTIPPPVASARLSQHPTTP